MCIYEHAGIIERALFVRFNGLIIICALQRGIPAETLTTHSAVVAADVHARVDSTHDEYEEII